MGSQVIFIARDRYMYIIHIIGCQAFLNILPHLAKALKVSADELMGLEKSKKNGRTKDTKLWRRFSQVEKLPPPKRKQIVQILDAFLGSLPR